MLGEWVSDWATGYVNKVSCCVRSLTAKWETKKEGRGAATYSASVWGNEREKESILTDVKEKTNWKQRCDQDDGVEMNIQC